MEAMRGQGGIQMLLSAEQEAQQIISNARNKKLARLRQAKEEAEREAAAYRSSVEANYQKKIAEGTGSSSSVVKSLEVETEIKIQRLKDVSSKVSSDVIKMLMNGIINVKN